MKIWMSSNNKNSKLQLNSIGFLLRLCIFNIIAVFTAVLSSILLFHNSKYILLLFVFIITATDVLCALNFGLSNYRDTLLFLRDNNGALFVVDMTKYFPNRRPFSRLCLFEYDKKKFLNNAISEKKFETCLSQEQSLHGLEIEITSIESIKHRKDGVNIVCHVIYPNYKKGRVFYFIKNGFEDQDSLLVDLESRLLPISDSRRAKRPHTKHLILSTILFLLNIVLCVMSHPVSGLINVDFYFYFLGGIPFTFWYFLYVVVTIRRGL